MVIKSKEDAQRVTYYKLVMKVMKSTPLLKKDQNSQDGVFMPIGKIKCRYYCDGVT
jgi:hypothetical protein